MGRGGDGGQDQASYELWRPFVTPAVNGMNEARQDSFDWAAGHAPEFIKAAVDAASATIAKHHAAA